MKTPTKWTPAKQHSLCILSCALLGASIEVIPEKYRKCFPGAQQFRAQMDEVRKTLVVPHWSVKGRKNVMACLVIPNDYMPDTEWPMKQRLYHWLVIWFCTELLWTDAAVVCDQWTGKSPVWQEAKQWLLSCNEHFYKNHDSEATRAFIMYEQIMEILKK